MTLTQLEGKFGRKKREPRRVPTAAGRRKPREKKTN